MATDKPISGFPLLAASGIQPGDLLIGVDVSDTSSSTAGTTKSMTLEDVLNNPNNGEVTGLFVPSPHAAAVLGGIVQTAQNGMTFESVGGSLTDVSFLNAAGIFLFGARTSDFAFLAPKFMGTSAVPTVVVGAGAGSGATVSVVGSDTTGVITLVTGTGVSIHGAMCTLTFSVPYANGVVGQVNYGLPASGSTSAFPPLAPLTTVTQMQIETLGSTALADTTTYTVLYQVIGYGN